MLLLVIGLAIFFTIHLVPTNVVLRDGLVRRLGAGTYRAVFSIISLAGLAIIVFGYHKIQLQPGKNPVLWASPIWLRHTMFLLMLPAIILLVASLIPSRIATAVRHPQLAAVKIWAFAHVLVNGDVGSLVLFGSFLAWAVYDRISLKHRSAGAKTDPGGGMGDIMVLGIGLALYVFLVKWGHVWITGVPLI